MRLGEAIILAKQGKKFRHSDWNCSTFVYFDKDKRQLLYENNNPFPYGMSDKHLMSDEFEIVNEEKPILFKQVARGEKFSFSPSSERVRVIFTKVLCFNQGITTHCRTSNSVDNAYFVEPEDKLVYLVKE